MIDEGEVDGRSWGSTWPTRSPPLNSLADLERLLPGQVDEVREWFTWYKATDADGNRIEGAEPNFFEFDGKPLDTPAALQIIAEGHTCWTQLVMRRCRAGKLKQRDPSPGDVPSHTPYPGGSTAGCAAADGKAATSGGDLGGVQRFNGRTTSDSATLRLCGSLVRWCRLLRCDAHGGGRGPALTHPTTAWFAQGASAASRAGYSAVQTTPSGGLLAS